MKNLLNSIKKSTLEELNALVIVPSFKGYPEERINKLLDESVDEIKKYHVNANVLGPIFTFKDAKNIRIKGVNNNYDFVVLLMITWTEAADMFYLIKDFLNKPVLLWSHTMWKEEDEKKQQHFGAVAGVGVVKKSLKDFGANFKFIYGMPGEKRIREELDLFIPAVRAIKKLDFSRIGLLGAPAMGMYVAWQDPLILEKILGPTINQVDQYILIEKINKIKDSDIPSNIIKDLKKKWVIDRSVNDELLIKSIKILIALIEMINENYWDALTVKCQLELSVQYKFAPCLPLSILADVFPTSCEGDIPVITTQLLFNSIINKPVTYCDLHMVDKSALSFACCGFSPLTLVDGKPKISRHSTLASGLLNEADYIESRVTVGRLIIDHDNKAYFHIAKGRSKKPEKTFREFGCAHYPSTNIFIDDPNDFAQKITGQHYAIIFDDIYDEIMEFCKLKNVNVL